MKSSAKKLKKYGNEQADTKLTDAWFDLHEGERTLTPELQQELEAIGIPTAEIVAAAEAPPPPKKRKGGWKNSGIPYALTAAGRREEAAKKAEAGRYSAQIMLGRYDEYLLSPDDEDVAWSPEWREKFRDTNLERRNLQKMGPDAARQIAEYDLARQKAFEALSPERKKEIKAIIDETYKRQKAEYDMARQAAFKVMLSLSPERRDELKAKDPAVYDLFDAVLRREVGEDWKEQFDDPNSAAAIRDTAIDLSIVDWVPVPDNFGKYGQWGIVENLKFADDGSGIATIVGFDDGGFGGLQARSVDLSFGSVVFDISDYEMTMLNRFLMGQTVDFNALFGAGAVTGLEDFLSFEVVWQGQSFYVVKSGVLADGWTLNAAVPEPATLAIVGVGLTGLGLARRRRK